MMKHGLIVLALTCWLTAATFAAEAGIPASNGMHGDGPSVLVLDGLRAMTPDELAAIEGGDLLLSVDRDKQMMTVTRITPGNYDNIQCYSVKVTTAVVRDQDKSSSNVKGAMENTARALPSGTDSVLPKQFPTGTATLSSQAGTSKLIEGPVIATNAKQNVSVVVDKVKTGQEKMDAGYAIHYVDPAKASNTLGCIGVQSQSGMQKVVDSLKVDNASYTDPASAKQTVTVTAYTNGSPPAPSTFKANEVPVYKPGASGSVSTPIPIPRNPPTPTPPAKPWYKFW